MERLRLRVHPGVRADRDDRRDHAARPRATTIRPAARSCCGRAASRTRGSRCASSTPRPATDVPDGEVGELWTRSPQNMTGYWANEEATASGDRRRRLVQDRRRRLPRRGRLPVPPRPGQGHDRVGRREHLSGRGRERARQASRRRRRRGDRRARRASGAKR